MFHPVIEKDIKEVISVLKNDLYELSGKNILITGASGMLASYLVYTLIYANENLLPKKAQLYLVIRNKKISFGNKKYIHYLYKDIVKDTIDIRNLHFIIHAASKAAPKIYTKNMLDTLNTNILGLYKIMNLVNKETASVLFFSTGELYGNPKGVKTIKEDYIGCFDHLNLRSCYVEGKRAGETICINYFREKNFPVKIARIFHTFGPTLDLNDGHAISDFMRDGLQKKDIEVLGDKNMKRPLLYVKDAAVMFFKILIRGTNGEVYNVANDKNVVSIEYMAKTICDIYNKYYGKKLAVKIRPQKIKYYQKALNQLYPDISKFKKEFKYTPSTTAEEAFTRTINYLLDYDKEK